MNPQERISEILNRLDELEILIANTFSFDREQAKAFLLEANTLGNELDDLYEQEAQA